MSYNNQIQKIRLQLVQLIAQSVIACNGHISTYYTSTGIPYKNVIKQGVYDSVSLYGIIQIPFSIAVNHVLIMHLYTTKNDVFKIIYNDGNGDHSTSSEKLSFESLYDIVKWLQSEMLLLAPRIVETCYHCGNTKVEKSANVAVNDDNAFIKYHDEVGTEGNWCPSCQHIHYSFVRYDQTNIHLKILNHWWGALPEEDKSRFIRHIKLNKDQESFTTPNEIWLFATSTEMKRKIWCNYREI